MKKLAIVLLLAFVLGITFSSCKSQNCPAYENDVTATTNDNASLNTSSS